MWRLGKKKWFCILMTALLFMTVIQQYAAADGEIIYLKGITTQHLAESGEIGLSVCATNGNGEGVKIKPSDLQVQINGQPVEAAIDQNSQRGHIFVVDYSLSAENKRWTYATEASASLISGLLNQTEVKDEVTVVWVGEANKIETVNPKGLEASYRAKRETVRSNTAHLYDGIDQAIDLAQKETNDYNYYNIYVLTDGMDNGSRVTLDYLSKKVQDSNSPISLFVCCYYNGSRMMETLTGAETARKALEQFTANLEGVYDLFDIQRGRTLEANVKHALNKCSNAAYGLLDVRVSLTGAPLDRKNGQTEIFVGLVSGSTAKRKTIYLPVDQLPAQTESAEPQDLYAVIQEKEDQIATLVSGAALKDAKINALEKTVEEQAAKIEPLEADLAEKKTRIEALEADAAEKTAKIETLETEKTEAAAKIKTLEANAAAQANRIAELETDQTEKAARIATLETDVAEKTEKIASLETDVAGKADKIETLEADVTKKTTQINTLESDVASKAEKIKTLEADVSEKAAKIETLEADTAEKASQITTLTTELTTKITEIATLQTSVKDRDAEIESLKTTISEETAQIEALKADVSEKETQVDQLTAKNQAQEAQLKIYKQKILDEGIAAGYNGPKSLQVIVPTRDYVIERLASIPDVGAIAAVTVDNDPNGQLGQEGQYIEQIYFSSPLVDPKYADQPDFDVISAGTACGGSVEVYRTIADAIERDNHLAYYDGTSSSTGSHTVVGTLVLRTSSGLPLVDQRKLESEMIEALTLEQ